MDIKQLLLEKTELKHNTNQRLGIIFEPFTWISMPGAVDEEFFSLFGKECSTLSAAGKLLCPELDEKWYNKNDAPEQQMESFLINASRFNKKMLPIIKDTINFYNKLDDYTSLFNQDNPLGFRALQSIEIAKDTAPLLMKDFRRMGTRIAAKDNNLKAVNLLTVLERVFDLILNADVKYNDALEYSEIEVKVNEGPFINAVLNNIKENISNHAFSTDKTKDNYVFDNLVSISFEEKEDSIIVSIANNGAPFKGDINKLFTPEYYHGQKGHSGYGLHSAKTAMKAMGGDLSITTGDGEFVFTYILTLKKHC